MKFLAMLAILLTGCSSFMQVVARPLTTCEKLCDYYFKPCSLAMETSPKTCYCEYMDMAIPPLINHVAVPHNSYAHITCTPDCVTAAKKIK